MLGTNYIDPHTYTLRHLGLTLPIYPSLYASYITLICSLYTHYMPLISLFIYPFTAYTSMPRELLRNHLINYSEPTAAVPSPSPSSPSQSSSSSSSAPSSSSAGQNNLIHNGAHPNDVGNVKSATSDSDGLHATAVDGTGTGPGCPSCGPSTHSPRARKQEGSDPPWYCLVRYIYPPHTPCARKPKRE